MAYNKFGGGDRGGSRFGGGRDFGGRPSFGGDRGGFRGGDRGFGGNRPPVQMHEATCAECNKKCEVPFRPSGEKPVYCNDCFGSNRGDRNDAPTKRFEKRDFAPAATFSKPQEKDSRIDDLKKQLEIVNTKMDAIIARLDATATTSAKAVAKEGLTHVVTAAVEKNATEADTKKKAPKKTAGKKK